MNTQKSPSQKNASPSFFTRLWRNFKRTNPINTTAIHSIPNDETETSTMLEYHNPTLGITDFKKREAKA